jgi:hypothetical protein
MPLGVSVHRRECREDLVHSVHRLLFQGRMAWLRALDTSSTLRAYPLAEDQQDNWGMRGPKVSK